MANKKDLKGTHMRCEEDVPQSNGKPLREKTALMLVNDVSRLFSSIINRENCSVQNSYRNLLLHLAREDGKTQLQLARLTRLKAPTVSVTLKRMEEEGYIVRRQDENDLRRTLVFLADKGREFNERIGKKIFDIESYIMRDISDDDITAAIRVLNKMRDNLLADLHMHGVRQQ